MAGSFNFMTVGRFEVAAWSVSGYETCVVVKKRDGFRVCFDLGFSLEQAVNCDTVFISHGHIDHIGGLPQHARKRQLLKLPPAKYYMPKEVVEPMRKILALYAEIHGEGCDSLLDPNLIPVEAGQTIQLTKNLSVTVFPTVHRVTSVGYLLRRRQMKRGAGEALEEVILPEMAYLGDTAFSVFQNPPDPDLLRVELLITEATYLDRPDDRSPSQPGLVTRAREYGHTHLKELAQNAQLFDDVGHLVLIHFSKRYSSQFIQHCVSRELPGHLANRVVAATMANHCMELSWEQGHQSYSQQGHSYQQGHQSYSQQRQSYQQGHHSAYHFDAQGPYRYEKGGYGYQ